MHPINYSLHVFLSYARYSRRIDSAFNTGFLYLDDNHQMCISGSEADFRRLADAAIEIADEMGHWTRRSAETSRLRSQSEAARERANLEALKQSLLGIPNEWQDGGDAA